MCRRRNKPSAFRTEPRLPSRPRIRRSGAGDKSAYHLVSLTADPGQVDPEGVAFFQPLSFPESHIKRASRGPRLLGERNPDPFGLGVNRAWWGSFLLELLLRVSVVSQCCCTFTSPIEKGGSRGVRFAPARNGHRSFPPSPPLFKGAPVDPRACNSPGTPPAGREMQDRHSTSVVSVRREWVASRGTRSSRAIAFPSNLSPE